MPNNNAAGDWQAALVRSQRTGGRARAHQPASPRSAPCSSSRSSATTTAVTGKPLRSTISSRQSGRPVTDARTLSSMGPRCSAPLAAAAVLPGPTAALPSEALALPGAAAVCAGSERRPGRRTACAGWPKIPSASRTSWAPRTGIAPSCNRVLVPTEAGFWTEPGTAPTSMPRRTAASTVCQDPPLAWHSTTTTICASPAMMRLRDGNRQACAGDPGGVSDTIAPSRATSPHSAACWRG